MGLELSSFQKAVASLGEAVGAYKSSVGQTQAQRDLMRDGVIQRFEYTFELCWKMLKRYLEIYSPEKPDVMTNRELFRMGFEQGMVRDVSAWFDYLQNRNLTSHTYNEETAERVYSLIESFLLDAKFLLQQLKNRTQYD